jgi:uncharacterized protein (DUF486 family)
MIQRLVVPAMIACSGAFMAFAWLGHLRIKEHSFWIALAMSWAIVLPEYVLNVTATRWGFGLFSGAQMAGFHLASGVVCVTIVSRFMLHEALTTTQMTGLGFIAAGVLLVFR